MDLILLAAIGAEVAVIGPGTWWFERWSVRVGADQPLTSGLTPHD